MTEKFNNGNMAHICDTCGALLTYGDDILQDFVIYQDGKHFCDKYECDQGSRDVGQKRVKKNVK
jgi:hypothetical protein